MLPKFYLGSARPINSENPKTKRFLPECKEQFLRFDSPTPVIIPNMTKNNPPTTGSGIVTNSEENFPHNENTISRIPATITVKLVVAAKSSGARDLHLLFFTLHDKT